MGLVGFFLTILTLIELVNMGLLVALFFRKDTDMSELSDKIAALDTKMDEVAAAQAAASASQTAEIARVEALIASFPPPVTPAEIAALDALNAKLDTLKMTEEAQKAEADAERP